MFRVKKRWRVLFSFRGGDISILFDGILYFQGSFHFWVLFISNFNIKLLKTIPSSELPLSALSLFWYRYYMKSNFLADQIFLNNIARYDWGGRKEGRGQEDGYVLDCQILPNLNWYCTNSQCTLYTSDVNVIQDMPKLTGYWLSDTGIG